MQNAIKETIRVAEETLINIDKYPEMYQPWAKEFWQGRKLQAEEILAKIISSNLLVSPNEVHQNSSVALRIDKLEGLVEKFINSANQSINELEKFKSRC